MYLVQTAVHVQLPGAYLQEFCAPVAAISLPLFASVVNCQLPVVNLEESDDPLAANWWLPFASVALY